MRLARTLIGMLHLQPLPGSPRWEGSMARVIDGALADARALVDGGMDALLVENYGDAPFTAGRVAAATVAGVTAVAAEIRRAFDQTLLGVNVLKNDARAALAVAAAVGGRFVRVNVHAGAGVTAETVGDLLSVADGVIVGTAVKYQGDVRNPVDRARVERLVAAARRC